MSSYKYAGEEIVRETEFGGLETAIVGLHREKPPGGFGARERRRENRAAEMQWAGQPVMQWAGQQPLQQPGMPMMAPGQQPMMQPGMPMMAPGQQPMMQWAGQPVMQPAWGAVLPPASGTEETIIKD